jgi:phage repressor protein C with HTH and peptisase S24 domain
MNSGYNIKEIRQLYNFTQQEMATALGITREMINKMEKGKRSISRATQARLKLLLQERQGEQFSQEAVKDVQFIGVPRRSSALPYHLHRLEQKNEASQFLVPLVAQKAQAGYVKSYDQVDYLDTLEKHALPPGVNPTGAAWSYFEVDGDSMEPTLCASDIILATMVPAEDWSDVKNFCLYVVLVGDQLLAKRIYKKSDKEWVLISDNDEAYPQITIKVADVKQLWLFRRHIRSRVPQPKEFVIN